MSKIILAFVFFCASCSENKSNSNSEESKNAVESISFKKNITHQNIDRFISESEIDGLKCTIFDVTESLDTIEINLELSLDKSSKFIYNNLVLSVNIGANSVSVPFQEFSSDTGTIEKAKVKISLDRSEGLIDDSRPFVSIAGSVSENLGNGAWGGSSSFYNVWDLMSPSAGSRRGPVKPEGE